MSRCTPVAAMARSFGRVGSVVAFTGLFGLASQAVAQSGAEPDPFAALAFLEGTWTATSRGAGNVTGHYVFRRELDRHILARHAAADSCNGPAGFDCDHGDLFYVFEDGPGAPLKAIYFDNEGHVIHYAVMTPSSNTVEFLSEPAPGPRFRLLYTRTGTEMSGKFQMQMPGQATWNSYLEWSGSRE